MPVAYLELMDRITAPMPPMPVVRLGTPPFRPMRRALSSSRVIILSSAGVHLRGDAPFAPINDSSFRLIPSSIDAGELRPSHPSPIRRPGRIDINVVHPYERLRELAEQGVIGGVTERHLAMLGAIKLLVPLLDELGPRIAQAARDEGADLCMLVPLCPACHQAVGLLARVIEACGLPTVTLATARDITARVRPPRAVFLDFPLGNSAGRPREADEQRRICRATLEAAARIAEPGTLVDLDERWPEPGWEREVVRAYEAEADIVRSQRAHEFDAAGRHLAAEQVALVEALCRNGAC